MIREIVQGSTRGRGRAAVEYFFYGTLMDGDVLARVVGQPVPPARMEAAVVEGYRRLYVTGAWYPMLVPAPGGRVEGRLVSGIDAAQAARIAHFESDAYELEALPVRAARRGPVRALTFMARPGVAASPEEWDLASWRRRHKRTYLRLVGVWMAGSRGRGRAGGGVCCPG